MVLFGIYLRIRGKLRVKIPIAQLVERAIVNHLVIGSSPAWGAKRKLK